MKKREKKPIFLKVLSLITLIFFVNIGYFIISNWNLIKFEKGMVTGNSIQNLFSEESGNFSFGTKLFLIIQWTFLFIILIIAAVRDRAIKFEKIELNNLQPSRDKNSTDIDALYDLLKKNKQIRVSSISKVFNVDKDVAMEWAKILEAGNLAIIDYPIIGGPLLTYETKKAEENKEKIDENIFEGKDIKSKKKNYLTLLFLILTLLFPIYPIYWLIVNQSNLREILQNKTVLILLSLFIISAIFFIIISIKSTRNKKSETKNIMVKEIKEKPSEKNEKVNKFKFNHEKIENLKKENKNISKDINPPLKKQKKKYWFFIFILFIITIGLAVYPVYLTITTDGNFQIIIKNKIAMILLVFFLLSAVITITSVISSIFRGNKKLKFEDKQNKNILKEKMFDNKNKEKLKR